MKRWLMETFGVALLLSGIIGCSQPCFLAKEVYDQSHNQFLPPRIECDPLAPTGPPLGGVVSAPPDVNSPDRPPRYLTLQEAIAIALESGTASGRAGAGQGVVDDSGLTFTPGSGTLNQQTDRIRVLALNPAMVSTGIEASISRFDAQWIQSMNWTNTDNLQQGLQSFSNGQGAAFQSSIVKAFSSGGVANVSFLTNYTNLASPPAGNFTVLNPSYNSSLIFGFEQPLWRDFGTSINQLLGRFPSINGQSMPNQAAAGFNAHQGLIGQNSGLGVEGILISRLRFDQSRAEFERNVQVLMLNAEVAYWKLYQAYGNLYSYEEVLRIAHKAWEINYAKFNIGTIGPANYHPIRGQYEEFRGERVKALNDVLEKERNLRGILGLPIEDGSRIVPITPPTMAEYKPDWESSLNDALNTKPEILLARENVRFHQYNLSVQKNYLSPDLRFVGQYNPVGFGTSLGGDDTFVDGTNTTRTSNSLKSLAGGHFNNWTLGLTLNMPLGFRAEHAAVRAARLQLAQSVYVLRDQEDRAKRVLTQQYQNLAQWYKLIETRRAERSAYQESVKARFSEFAAGKNAVSDFLLDAQRRLAAAQLKEYEAIAEYNNTLSRLEWAKGAIMRHNNVHIAEGGLPQQVQVRAVENEKERTQAIVLRERPRSHLQHPGWLLGGASDMMPDHLEENLPPGAAPRLMPMPETLKEILQPKTEKTDKIELIPAPKQQPAALPATPEKGATKMSFPFLERLGKALPPTNPATKQESSHLPYVTPATSSSRVTPSTKLPQVTPGQGQVQLEADEPNWKPKGASAVPATSSALPPAIPEATRFERSEPMRSPSPSPVASPNLEPREIMLPPSLVVPSDRPTLPKVQ